MAMGEIQDMYEEEQQEQQGGGGNKWLWGCGIGCGVLVVLVIVVGGVGYFMIQAGLRTMGEMATQQIEDQYETMKEQADIPEEYEATYDELVDLATGEEASPWVQVLALPVILGSLEDGEVTEEEFEMLQHVAEVLRDNPDAGLMDLQRIFEEHPELYDNFKQIQEELEEAEDLDELDGLGEPAT